MSAAQRSKVLGRLLMKSIVLAIPFFILFIVVLVSFNTAPMRFFDGEYSWYQENQDLAISHNDYRVLICGDSQAKAAWVPASLTEDTYNYALGGVSPIEEYYCLQDYFENHELPEYVIYTQGLTHFLESDSFWSRSVYFHRLNKEQVTDILAAKKSINDKDDILGDKNQLDVLLYYSYSPIYYSSAFLKGLLFDRQGENEVKYDDAVSARGHILFGEGGGEIKPAGIAKLTSFFCNELIDSYLNKIIQLCKDRGVKFVYQSAPVSEITYESIDKAVLAQYDAYMDELRTKYPGVVINSDLLVYTNGLFSDSVHLNTDGADKYSREMYDKYSYIFEE